MKNHIEAIRTNPEKVKEIVKKTILINQIHENLQELFYLIPIEKRDYVEKMCDTLREI